MKPILLALALAGCSHLTTNETLTLQCLGFCMLTSVEYEIVNGEKVRVKKPAQPVKLGE